ncbi:hypothetical protein PLESTB_001597900 [Pleodorina starrii]|uniref:Uncharacterized protein n=1 Tax=Pleodorina starrii TaxID=330485 RepID=A0A9W6BXZ8_9CHLO|nr:hypothetical protein PLESTB_001597900 [Pleodorina starrii]GLC75383.1 hypothetical protein PLESTF_001630900 [Pleodorina starrii]
MKSPDRTRRAGSSRFSPNRPLGSGTVKRLLWNKDLPPRPPPAADQEQTATGVSDDCRSAPRDDSPTRHTVRATSATEIHGPPPLAPNAGSLGGSDVDADLIRSLSISGSEVGHHRCLAHRDLLSGGLGAAGGGSCLGGEPGEFSLPAELGSHSETADPTPNPNPVLTLSENEEGDENAAASAQPSSAAPASAGILGCTLPR